MNMLCSSPLEYFLRGTAVMSISRRDFINGVTAATLLTPFELNMFSAFAAPTRAPTGHSTDGYLRVWASACSHVGHDLAAKDKITGTPLQPREALAEAIRQSEGFNNDGAPPFPWDIGLHLGDFSAEQGTPTDHEGREIVRQFGSARLHKREQFYCLAGNHDAAKFDEPEQWWFRKWVDPLGENTAYSGVKSEKRPYAIEGTWERYSFRVGNILFLMMSDANHLPPPVGRGERGGYPAGAVTRDTFDWWKRMVEANKNDSIIITAHHNVLKDTTVASGDWEGFNVSTQEEFLTNWKRWYPDRKLGERRLRHPEDLRYHGYFSDGGPRGASYLFFVGEEEDSGLFESYLAENPGSVDLWLGAHTHTHPDDTFGGKSHVEEKWGTVFVNCAALTSYQQRLKAPKSRLLTFRPSSNKVRIQCYLHSADVAPRGWYDKAERRISLNQSFEV
jgi:hypothetical protein